MKFSRKLKISSLCDGRVSCALLVAVTTGLLIWSDCDLSRVCFLSDEILEFYLTCIESLVDPRLPMTAAATLTPLACCRVILLGTET